MSAILVTGGAGYIGSHAVKALRATGREVVVLDNLMAGHREAVLGAPLVEADIADVETVRRTIRIHQVTAVMHFAALLDVGESVKVPGRYYDNNVARTLALIGALVDESVPAFIFSSTAAVYGTPAESPIGETHPTRPINAYGETKLAIERALPHYEQAYGLEAIRLRYFNAAGADPDGEIGEDHEPEIHVIPRALAAAADGPPLAIFGGDYDTPDGTCIRDYVHVSDLAAAHVQALERLERGGGSGVYNLGNGWPSSVREVVAAVGRVLGRDVPHTVEGRRPGDPAVLCAASRKARDELGWVPRYESLDVIVETAAHWHQTHPAGYGAGVST